MTNTGRNPEGGWEHRPLVRRTANTAGAAIVAGLGFAQSAMAGAPYCESLKQVAGHALHAARFSSIAGAPLDGNFSETTLPLSGWIGCSLYGATAYTCDSPVLADAEAAEKAQTRIIDEILSCFAGTWLHILDRSSPGYAVLHPAKGAASITLSVDVTDDKQFVVRLTLFIRRG
jgi:hypothetical protein